MQRGLSFLGDGLAHASFGGVALGLLIGVSQPLWVALPFALRRVTGHRLGARAHATLVGYRDRYFLRSFCRALGVLFISLQEGYTVDAWQLLFGSILGITQGDLWVVAGVSAPQRSALCAALGTARLRDL